MNLTEQEKKFLKHFIGGIGSYVSQTVVDNTLEEHRRYGTKKEYNELKELLATDTPLSYLNSIYLKLEG